MATSAPCSEKLRFFLVCGYSGAMQRNNHLAVDASLICISVVLAFLIAKIDIARYLLGFPDGLKILAPFIAGLCFVSVFTVAPATVVLGQLATENSLFFVVALGGLGALSGDFLIFKFFRKRIADDLARLRALPPRWRLQRALRSRATRWVSAALGALIIASPLPDEIGLAMLGLARVQTKIFIPLSFILNASGILAIGLIARAL